MLGSFSGRIMKHVVDHLRGGGRRVYRGRLPGGERGGEKGGREFGGRVKGGVT